MIAVGLSVSVICCAAHEAAASPLDPAGDAASAFGPIMGPVQMPDVIRMPIGNMGPQTTITAGDIDLRTDILGDLGQEAVVEEMPVVTMSRDAGASGDDGRELMPRGRDKAKAKAKTRPRTRDALKTVALALPPPGPATDSREDPRTRGPENGANGRLGYVLSLSGYPSQVLVDEVLVPLADLLLAPEFDENGRISFNMLGLGDFSLDVALDEGLPGGGLSFAALSWQGHGGISLYSHDGSVHYARRDRKGAVRPMTLKEIILNILYELITLPIFYISIAGVVLVLAVTSSKRA